MELADLGWDDDWAAALAAYLQAGRSFGRWTPYARAERAELDQNDNFFAAQASGQSYTRAVLGLSGGVDSSVVAYLAAEALGPENVVGVRMPSVVLARRTSTPRESHW